MDKLIENKIEELYSLIMDMPNKVLDIFNEFFGEERVDMQGFPSMETFKTWICQTPVSEYILQKYFNIGLEEYAIYIQNSLTHLEGDALNSALDLLCNHDIIKVIGENKFNSGYILVHFPHVRITNEFGRFVDVHHLYAKVALLYNGTLQYKFFLNRAEYPYSHFYSNYMHSHISNIPKDDFTNFQCPCTGRGPIINTISTLNKEFDSDMWKLFCLELSKFVETESISGVPYHELEKIGISNESANCKSFLLINSITYSSDAMSLIKDFTSYFIKHSKLKFNYANNSYSIGMSFTEYMIMISNEFIKWYNEGCSAVRLGSNPFETLKHMGLLCTGNILNNTIYYSNETTNNIIERYMSYNDKHMCFFKGRDIKIKILGPSKMDTSEKSIFLRENIALYILSKILRIINYKYGKTKQRNSENSKKIKYL